MGFGTGSQGSFGFVVLQKSNSASKVCGEPGHMATPNQDINGGQETYRARREAAYTVDEPRDHHLIFKEDILVFENATHHHESMRSPVHNPCTQTTVVHENQSNIEFYLKPSLTSKFMSTTIASDFTRHKFHIQSNQP